MIEIDIPNPIETQKALGFVTKIVIVLADSNRFIYHPDLASAIKDLVNLQSALVDENKK